MAWPGPVLPVRPTGGEVEGALHLHSECVRPDAGPAGRGQQAQCPGPAPQVCVWL